MKYNLIPNIGALPIRFDESAIEVSHDVGILPSRVYERRGRIFCEEYGTTWVYYDDAGCFSIVLQSDSVALFEEKNLFELSYEDAREYLKRRDIDAVCSKFGECTSLRLGIRLSGSRKNGNTLKSILMFNRGAPFCEEEIRKVARRWVKDEDAIYEIEEFLWAGEMELALETLHYMMADSGILRNKEAAKDLTRVEGMIGNIWDG